MFFTFWVVVELTSQDEMVLDMLHYLYIIYILGLSADFWLQRYDKIGRLPSEIAQCIGIQIDSLILGLYLYLFGCQFVE